MEGDRPLFPLVSSEVETPIDVAPSPRGISTSLDANGDCGSLVHFRSLLPLPLLSFPPYFSTSAGMNAPNPPMRAAIVPVTAFQQNCTLLWCTATNKAAFVDPGGDLPKLKEAVQQTGVEVEKILVTPDLIRGPA